MHEYKAGDYSKRMGVIFLVLAAALGLAMVAILIVPDLLKGLPKA